MCVEAQGKRLGTWLRLLVSGALLGLVLWRVPIDDVALAIRTFDATFIAPILALFALAVLIRSAKLRYLSQLGGGRRVSFWRILRIVLLSYLAYTVVPSVDLAQVGLLGREKRSFSRAAVIVSLDRLSGMVMLFAIGTLALALRHEQLRSLHPLTSAGVVLLLLAGLLALCAPFSRRVHATLRRLSPSSLQGGGGLLARGARSLLEALEALRGPQSAIPAALGFALVFQLVALTVQFAMCRGLGIAIAFEALAAIIPLAVAASILPSILGIGVRDAAYVVLFAQLGIDAPQAVALSLMQLALILIAATLGAILLAAGKRERSQLPGE